MGGISQVIGGLALLGFLLFLAGVGLVVVAASQGRPVRGGILLAIIGLVAGILLSVVSQGIIVVAPQEIAVVFQTVSGELGTPRGPGTHVVIPILQDATIYPIERDEYTMSGIPQEGQMERDDSVRGRTSDGQEVFLDITVIYRVDPSQVNRIHQNWQRRYEDDFVRPTARSVPRAVVANFTAERIYGEERDDLEQQMQTELAELLDREGLELIELLLRDITFSDEFTQAIEEASVAQQQAERERRRIEQIRAEAEQNVVEAQGQRDAAIAVAEGNAQALILDAQARAEGLSLVSEQLAANPLLIQYEYIQNLGDVNLALVPSNSPFLFDFDSINDLPAPSDIEVPEVDAGSTLELSPSPGSGEDSSEDSGN